MIDEKWDLSEFEIDNITSIEDVNDNDSEGYTALCFAALNNVAPELLIYLANKKGALVNKKCNKGKSPIQWACMAMNKDAVKALTGGEVSSKYINSDSDPTSIPKQAYDNGLPLYIDSNGIQTWLPADDSGNANIPVYIENKTTINDAATVTRNDLLSAAILQNGDILHALIEVYSGDIKAVKDNYDNNLLHLAVIASCYDSARAIKDIFKTQQQDFENLCNAKNNVDKSPVDIAAENGDVGMLEILIGERESPLSYECGDWVLADKSDPLDNSIISLAGEGYTVIKSNSNYHATGEAQITITINKWYTCTLPFKIMNLGEDGYDYPSVILNNEVPIYDSKEDTGLQFKDASVTIESLSGSPNTLTVTYHKDDSVDSDIDRAYLAIPNCEKSLFSLFDRQVEIPPSTLTYDYKSINHLYNAGYEFNTTEKRALKSDEFTKGGDNISTGLVGWPWWVTLSFTYDDSQYAFNVDLPEDIEVTPGTVISLPEVTGEYTDENSHIIYTPYKWSIGDFSSTYSIQDDTTATLLFNKVNVTLSFSSDYPVEISLPDVVTVESGNSVTLPQVTGEYIDESTGITYVPLKWDIGAFNTSYTLYRNITASLICNESVITVGIVFDNSHGTLSEGSSASRAFKLASAPTSNVIVNVNTDRSDRLNISPQTLEFTPTNWNSHQYITFTATDNSVIDGDIIANILVSSVSSDINYNGLSYNSLSFTVEDNDTAGIVFDSSDAVLIEGTVLQRSFRLRSHPTSSVTVNLSSDHGNRLSISPMAITFTASNWETPQHVTFSATDNSVVDGDVSVTLSISSLSADTHYNNLSSTFTITVRDNDVDDSLGELAFVTGPFAIETGTAIISYIRELYPDIKVNYPIIYSDFNKP